MPLLIDIATAVPPFRLTQARAGEELKKRMGGRPAVARMIDAAASYSGIDNRFIVIPDAEPDVSQRFYPTSPDDPAPDTKRRMDLYKKWSSTLSINAGEQVLRSTGTPPSAISRLITISCTGFSGPNFDYALMSALGLPAHTQRTHIGFMGCAAAVIGCTSVLDAVLGARDGNATVLLIALELCSLHVQTAPTRDNILANMIFADGCAAALFRSDSGQPAPARLVQTQSVTFPDSRAFMGWEIGNQGFEMTLSSELPRLITDQAIPAARAMMHRMGLRPDDIDRWALHPGGRAILDALQTGLSLSDDQVAPSRAVLQHYGNMSSASILFVLKEVLSRGPLVRDQWLCAIAFGPGLTMELAFLRGI